MKAMATAWIALALLVAARPGFAAERVDVAALGRGYAQHLADLINRYRQQHGLGRLMVADDLASMADQHTSQMADQRRLSHDGFRDRFDRTNAKICVENVGRSYPVAEALLDGWRASPGHDRNLLEPKVARMGIAVSGSYVTYFACS
jgi:uncharacterized protein YkwD